MHSEPTCKKQRIYSSCILASTPLGPNRRRQCKQLPETWDSTINSAHVPIEVGKFQSDSSRPNPMFSAILCFKMSPECILSRLAKNNESILLASWHRRHWGQTGAGSASSCRRQCGVHRVSGVPPSALWCVPHFNCLGLVSKLISSISDLIFFRDFHRSMRTC